MHLPELPSGEEGGGGRGERDGWAVGTWGGRRLPWGGGCHGEEVAMGRKEVAIKKCEFRSSQFEDILTTQASDLGSLLASITWTLTSVPSLRQW